MIKKNRLTIVIQPDWKSSGKKIGQTFTFSFPKRLILFLFIVLTLLVMFGIKGSKTIAKNIQLQNRLSNVQHSLVALNNIESQFKKMRKEERIIRAFLGLESSEKNFDINERMGQGGTQPTDDVMPLPLDPKQELKDTEDNRPLHMRVDSLMEDLHELTRVLSKMNKKLNCRPTIMPVKESDLWITSGFGWRKSPFTGLREFHKGLDISGKRGAPIIATADGVAEGVGYDRFLGNYVDIKHDNRFSSFYGHLQNSIVKVNQKVVRGQVVGYVGTTGVSTGYHLHYEVSDNQKKVNPYNFILNRTEVTLASNLNEE